MQPLQQGYCVGCEWQGVDSTKINMLDYKESQSVCELLTVMNILWSNPLLRA